MEGQAFPEFMFGGEFPPPPHFGVPSSMPGKYQRMAMYPPPMPMDFDSRKRDHSGDFKPDYMVFFSD